MTPRTTFEYRSPAAHLPVKRVEVDKVTHILAEDKLSVAYYPGGSLLLDESLVSLAREFPDHFIQCNRATLVPRRALLSLLMGPKVRQLRLNVRDLPFLVPVGRSFHQRILPLFGPPAPGNDRVLLLTGASHD